MRYVIKINNPDNQNTKKMSSYTNYVVQNGAFREMLYIGSSLDKSLHKRGVLEIMASMLECLKEGPLRKTHVTYKTGVDTRTASKYISFLLSQKFVERSKDDESLLFLTAKGGEFLAIYENLIRKFGIAAGIEFGIKISNLQA